MERTGKLAAAALVVAAAASLGWSAREGATAQEQIDLDSIFRCRAEDDAGKAQCLEARGLIMNNCNQCHSFIRIVYYQASATKWAPVLARMHLKAPQLSDEQMATIAAYVAENFGEDQPPPQLPPSLVELSRGGG